MLLNSKRPRIAPVEPPYSHETAEVLDRMGRPIELFRVFARRPDLARGVVGWGSYYLSRRSALTLRQRELVIDRTTARCGADYEWGVHIAAFATKAELSPDQITSLALGDHTDPCWIDPADRAVLRAVDELHANADLADDTWEALMAEIGEAGTMDLLLLTGWYHAISFAVRALRLPLEPGTSPRPSHDHAGAAADSS